MKTIKEIKEHIKYGGSVYSFSLLSRIEFDTFNILSRFVTVYYSGCGNPQRKHLSELFLY